MKINSVKRLILGDFPKDEQKWLNQLFVPLNQFLEQAVTVLQGNITLSDNCKTQKFSLNIAASQVWPIKLSYNLNERPTEVRVAYLVEDNSDPQPPTNAYSCYWQYDSGVLEVTLVGLDAAKKYKTLLLAQV